MPEYIVDTDHNDGYTAPELHDEAVALVGKLNPQPLVRCRDCKHYETGICRMLIWRKSGFPPSVTVGDRYCAWGERKDRS